jgi:hypothetical protein
MVFNEVSAGDARDEAGELGHCGSR